MFMKKFRLLSALTALMLLVSAAAPVRATEEDIVEVVETTAPVEMTVPVESWLHPAQTHESGQRGGSPASRPHTADTAGRAPWLHSIQDEFLS